MELRDFEKEKQGRRRKKILIVAVLMAFIILSIPIIRDRYTKWQAQAGARQLASYLNKLRSRAILEKKTIEARFVLPSTIEVSIKSSCAKDAHIVKKVETKSLYDFRDQVEFVTADWLKEAISGDVRGLYRFCYDPLNGALPELGDTDLAAIPLAHRVDKEHKRLDHLVVLSVSGSTGEIYLE